MLRTRIILLSSFVIYIFSVRLSGSFPIVYLVQVHVYNYCCSVIVVGTVTFQNDSKFTVTSVIQIYWENEFFVHYLNQGAYVFAWV